MDLALRLVLWLAGALAAVAAALVAGRLVADRVRARRDRARRLLVAAMNATLPKTIAETLFAPLRVARNVALDALVEVALAQPAARPRLAPIFRELRFLEQEMRATAHRRWSRRMAAAVRLGLMGDRAALPPLRRLLDDEMLDVRLAAAGALAQLGATDAVAAILGALAVRGDESLKLVSDTLLEYGPAAVPPLVAFLDARTVGAASPAATVAISVLGHCRSPDAVPVLIRALADPVAEVRINATRALGLVGGRASMAALATCVADPVWEVRSAVAQALGRGGEARDVPLLATLLTDRAWWVRCNAAVALSQLGAAGRECLLAASQSHPDRFARDISREVLARGVAATKPSVAT